MKSVSLFIPCLVDQFLPEIGVATTKVFRKLGVKYSYDPRQTCCGQPFINSGDMKGARKVARHFISIFEESDYIVAPSGSCIHTIKHQYPKIFALGSDWYRRAKKVAARAYELSQFIVSVLDVKDIGSTYEVKACLHESCSVLRQLGVSDEPKALLNNVKGLELVPLNDANVCCGFGGEFSMDYPEISEAIVKDKANNFEASGADTLILMEPGCLLHIKGYLTHRGTKAEVVHIAEVLAGM